MKTTILAIIALLLAGCQHTQTRPVDWGAVGRDFYRAGSLMQPPPMRQPINCNMNIDGRGWSCY